MERAVGDLMWVLDYQLRVATRYLRVVSVVMAASSDREVRIEEALRGSSRGSDAFFELGDGAVIVMAETGLAQAFSAVERYKKHYDGEIDVRYAAGAFPNDGNSAAKLLSTLRCRLERARALGPGAVVSAD